MSCRPGDGMPLALEHIQSKPDTDPSSSGRWECCGQGRGQHCGLVNRDDRKEAGAGECSQGRV
jgi:hypothetical protein